ncbi:DUF481 domain-containing protein [Alteromonas sp. RKMC-009]|uniref:DUF481 domain-containing protein n=1 Tax=Alteromonas sp. RKMC-009 TaxID=2267264 RepID=UPI000C677225|nr:DUF481 domain-containing protein [Alteromonas sp. RKMC-009]AYA66614.1 DUF481 domain-containing protein [Alteromonas sp. RKMC-009]MBT82179.1 hypothetical protein [Alteromonadaceae bacterium]MEC7691474.1 DUF481 domain-containing protein [Pseudomonadota bacterium]
MKKQLLAVAVLSAMGTTSALAQDDAKPFTLEGGLGFIFTSGNTETTSINASLEGHQELEKWSNDYTVEGLYKKETVTDDDTGEDVERTSAQKFFASGQGNYKLENPDYRLFGFASYEDDRFSSYNYQSTVAAGWNQKVWQNDTTSLEYSIGPGYSWAETQEDVEQNSFIVRASGAFEWLISDTAKFSQTVSTEVGDENTKSRAESALTATISGNLSMKLSVKLDHNSRVNEGVEKLDTATAVTLVYSFF